jgi:hypothetical protein
VLDTLARLCKQGVRGSSPLSSTPGNPQVTGYLADACHDLHEAPSPRRARCVPDRRWPVVPCARLELRFSSSAARTPSASAISRCRSAVECKSRQRRYAAPRRSPRWALALRRPARRVRAVPASAVPLIQPALSSRALLRRVAVCTAH